MPIALQPANMVTTGYPILDGLFTVLIIVLIVWAIVAIARALIGR
jgi:divalent metal cation (Fe/Co/Zn/Cd) transporter